MFVVQVVGLKKVDYQRKSDSKQITGAELFIMREPTAREQDVTGFVTDKIYIGSQNDLYSDVVSGKFLGKSVSLVYEYDGRFNHLVDLQIVEPEKKGA